MKETCNVAPLRHCDEIDDQLVNILRSGVRRLFAQAIESEAEAFLAAMKDLKLTDGRDRVVRHGHGPTRANQTGIGPVKIRDRGAARDDERIRVTSAILPLWAASDEKFGRASAGSPPAGHFRRTSRRRWQHLWAPMRRIFLRRCSAD